MCFDSERKLILEHYFQKRENVPYLSEFMILGHMNAGKGEMRSIPAVLNSSTEASGVILIKVCSCVRKGSSVKYVLNLWEVKLHLSFGTS